MKDLKTLFAFAFFSLLSVAPSFAENESGDGDGGFYMNLGEWERVHVSTDGDGLLFKGPTSVVDDGDAHPIVRTITLLLAPGKVFQEGVWLVLIIEEVEGPNFRTLEIEGKGRNHEFSTYTQLTHATRQQGKKRIEFMYGNIPCSQKAVEELRVCGTILYDHFEGEDRENTPILDEGELAEDEVQALIQLFYNTSIRDMMRERDGNGK